MLAEPLNMRPKYVASTTLVEPLEWQHSTLLRGDVGGAVQALKAQDGDDLLVIGGPGLVQSLLDYAPTESAAEFIGAWSPEDATAHIEFQRQMNQRLTESGELVEAQALTGPEQAKFVVYDGVGTPVVTDGPFPEGKELLAGYRMIDVESLERPSSSNGADLYV